MKQGAPDPTEPVSLLGGESIIADIIGGRAWFHNGEVLSLFPDRRGPALTMTILFPSHRTNPSKGFIAKLLFQEAGDIVIEGFNFQERGPGFRSSGGILRGRILVHL